MKESKLHLKENPTLKDFQDYVQKMTKEHGWDGVTVPEVFMLFRRAHTKTLDYCKFIMWTARERFENLTITMVMTHFSRRPLVAHYNLSLRQYFSYELLEECGEMAKAARQRKNMYIANDSSREHPLEHEIADVFILLLDICNHFDINLEKAFRKKEEINKARTWQKK